MRTTANVGPCSQFACNSFQYLFLLGFPSQHKDHGMPQPTWHATIVNLHSTKCLYIELQHGCHCKQYPRGGPFLALDCLSSFTWQANKPRWLYQAFQATALVHAATTVSGVRWNACSGHQQSILLQRCHELLFMHLATPVQSVMLILQAGTYTVTYSAADKAGNVGTATRSVVVASPCVSPNFFCPATCRSAFCVVLW